MSEFEDSDIQILLTRWFNSCFLHKITKTLLVSGFGYQSITTSTNN